MSRAAEYHVLETFDVIRPALGHDYGNGQRASELFRRRRELTAVDRQDLEDGVSQADVSEAWHRIAKPRIRRIELEHFRRETPATKRTIEAWRRTRRALGVGGPVAV